MNRLGLCAVYGAAVLFSANKANCSELSSTTVKISPSSRLSSLAHRRSPITEAHKVSSVLSDEELARNQDNSIFGNKNSRSKVLSNGPSRQTALAPCSSKTVEEIGANDSRIYNDPRQGGRPVALQQGHFWIKSPLLAASAALRARTITFDSATHVPVSPQELVAVRQGGSEASKKEGVQAPGASAGYPSGERYPVAKDSSAGAANPNEGLVASAGPVLPPDPQSVPVSAPDSRPYQCDLADEPPPLPLAYSPQQAIAQDPDAKVTGPIPSSSPAEPRRRAYPAPLDPVFPMTEWIGSAGTLPIGVPDTDPEYPLEKAIYKIAPQLRQHRIKIYGWANPGWGYSSSKYSNIPNSYAIVPNRLELDQLILRAERIPDTVQREKCDWGFRVSQLYGIDYRWTTAAGWYPASSELLKHNMLYGYDIPELYGMFYIPKVAKGMVLKFGRFISPPDIEAQLAPDNFMWTHSQMFTYDCYTQTGILATIKLNDQWSVQGGIHAGCDTAPWDKGAIPTGEFFVKWTSKTNNDSIYTGVDAINNGRYRGARSIVQAQQMTAAMNGLIQQAAELNGGVPDTSVANFVNPDGSIYQYQVPKKNGKDNLQQFNFTWSHRWNEKGTIVSLTEAYLLYQLNALTGGTVNNGPPRTYFAGVGPGSYIHGWAPTVGVVNYTAFKLTDKDYICVRPIDYLVDYKGQRSGYPTTMTSWTVNWTHRFNNLVCIRPEIRYDRALNYHNGNIVKPYDNGRRRFQFTFGLDVIARF